MATSRDNGLFEPIEPVVEAPPSGRDLFAGGEPRRRWWRYHVADARAGWFEIAQHHVLRPLPVDLCSALGGWYARRFPEAVAPGAEQRRLLRENGRRLGPPGADERTLAEMERRWWDNVGRMKAEYSVVPRIFREGRVNIEGGDRAEAAMTSGRPVIFLSAHHGNWEILLTGLCGRGGLGERLGQRIVAPHSVARNRFRRGLATAIRKRHGRLAFPPGPESARRFHRILAARAGHLVLLVDSLKEGGIASPRFGRPHPPTSNLTIAARLATMTDALLVPAQALRTDGARFRLVFGEPIDPRAFPAGEAGRAALADRISDVIEAELRRNLEQWSNLRRLDLPPLR